MLSSLEHITTVLIVCLTVNETALVGFLGRESHSTETETINSTSNAFRFCVAPIAATALFSAKCVATAQHNARRVLGDDWEQRYTALLVSCHDFDAATAAIAGDDEDDANDDEPYNYHKCRGEQSAVHSIRRHAHVGAYRGGIRKSRGTVGW